MSNEALGASQSQGQGQGGRPEYEYFVDGKLYKTPSSSITGAEIKAKIPNFNPTFQLFLEGKGGAPDRAIADSDAVELDKGARHLYTAPPATFGAGRALSTNQ